MYRTHLFLFVFLLISINGFSEAQSIEGSWKGSLNVGGQELPLIFHIERVGESLIGSMDSPNQGTMGLKLKKVLHEGMMLSLELQDVPATYEGLIMGDSIQGNFKQSGMSLPLNLIRMNKDELNVPKKQEPLPPFPYQSKEISFKNTKENIQINGTLTLPEGEGPFPAVILVTGSGPQNRDSEMLGHKPFLVLADHLTRNGIAVLRYDERGVGESEGSFKDATSHDFKRDATFAIKHLKQEAKVDAQKIGVIGHSEGALIAWMLGSEMNELNFIVPLAGPVVPISQLMEQQTMDQLLVSGIPENMADNQMKLNSRVYQVFIRSKSLDGVKTTLQNEIRDYLHENSGIEGEFLEKQTELTLKPYLPSITPWFFEFIKLDPETYIRKVNIPVFAAFGELDKQVHPYQNSERLDLLIQAYDKKDFSSKIYPKLNHLFQTAETGGIPEYANNEESFNELVMKDIVSWILAL
ncbi:alpha/beta hydrolase family protein [Pararhodonellum marinum]|uniref:alpha/beta hydrolase family protein n=1 Tax=Pararhodonellum marinum TaxID=2755358 RepID=UPI00188F1992|nr:alpha/beta fold hydrolase [Pararhodonellum marinum]